MNGLGRVCYGFSRALTQIPYTSFELVAPLSIRLGASLGFEYLSSFMITWKQVTKAIFWIATTI